MKLSIIMAIEGLNSDCPKQRELSSKLINLTKKNLKIEIEIIEIAEEIMSRRVVNSQQFD